MDVAIDAIEAVMHAAESGDAEAPVRTMQSVMRPGKEDFVFVVMPGVWGGRQVAAAKIVSNVPDNPLENRATVQGVAVMLDVETGSDRGCLDINHDSNWGCGRSSNPFACAIVMQCAWYHRYRWNCC